VSRTSVLLVVLAVAVASCATEGSPDRFVPATGNAPNIAGTTLGGTPIGAADYEGKVLLVNFWNPDCPPCRDEMPVLQAAWDRDGGRGLYVLGIMYVGGGWPNDPAAAQAFLAREGITYPTIVDQASTWAAQFNIAGIPTTVVVDEQGQIRYRLLGRVAKGDAEQLLSQLSGAGSGSG
jgi:cytochrome c biogenesis protein CcmG, thiol:disulfide interchange protein DsbE